MNIGIIVYSKTGNTLLVAERTADALMQAGNQVKLHRFTAEMESAQSNKLVRLSHSPDPNGYDALIIGAPVQAFSLDPAMTMYLQQFAFTKKTPTYCFITQHFKKQWMGGNHAMKQLTSHLRAKGIAADSLGIVNWSGERREKQIDNIVEQCRMALRGEVG